MRCTGGDAATADAEDGGEKKGELQKITLRKIQKMHTI